MARYEEIENIQKYPNIARKLDTAERLIDSDPDMAVTAMRTATELMLKQLCLKYTGEEGEDNSARINALHKKSVIGDKLKNGLHKIRLTANDSLHEGYEVEDYDAEMKYRDVLDLARIFVDEVDPSSATNRGIKLYPGSAIVPERENVTAGFGMTREQRNECVKNAAIDLSRWVEGWKERCRRSTFDPDDPWDMDNWYEEMGRYQIPAAVCEYFIEYRDGKRLGAVREIIERRSGALDLMRPAVKQYILEAAERSSSITLPDSNVWDYIKEWSWIDGTADDYLEDREIYTLSMDDTAWLLNEAFTGGDGSGFRPMHLTDKVTELTLPEWKHPDGSDMFDLPGDLPLLMVYFPKLEKVTLRGETFETANVIKEAADRLMTVGSIMNGKLASVPGSLIPDSGYAATASVYMVPETAVKAYDWAPDKKRLNWGNYFFMFTLLKYYRDRFEFNVKPKLIPGTSLQAPLAADPLDTEAREIREYIAAIEGEKIKLEQVAYTDGFEMGLSYRTSGSEIGANGYRRVKPCLDPQEPFYRNGVEAYNKTDFLVLPEWVYDGAKRFATTVDAFVTAVSKVRPELFDTYKPELHVGTPEPAAPAETPAKAAGFRFCPYCGAPVSGYRFCIKCGKQLVQ